MSKFTNKIALVTGASRGIGEAIARGLAEEGAHVIISSRKQADCQTVADSINQNGGSAEAFACHIGDMEQISAVFDHIKNKHGRLDALVNNAATNPYFGPIEDTDLGVFSKTLDVNIRGYFFMCAEAVKIMSTHGGGSIVNVASVNGVKPGFYQGIYSITKAAVISMTQAFAAECGPKGVRVNALLPGLTETKFAATLTSNEDIMNQVTSSLPLRRSAQPEEMVGAVLYLLSDGASYTTGSCLTVDGGHLIAAAAF